MFIRIISLIYSISCNSDCLVDVQKALKMDYFLKELLNEAVVVVVAKMLAVLGKQISLLVHIPAQ